MKTGVEQIREEREKQKEKGFDVSHDRQHHTSRELTKAAVCLLLFYIGRDHPMATDHSWFRALPNWIQELAEDLFPCYEDSLRVAAALCAAELDRIVDTE